MRLVLQSSGDLFVLSRACTFLGYDLLVEQERSTMNRIGAICTLRTPLSLVKTALTRLGESFSVDGGIELVSLRAVTIPTTM